MNDIDLLDFMVRQYQTQAKMAQALKLTDGAISKWRSRGELPRAWRMYFQAQFDKTDESRVVLTNYANQFMQGALNDLQRYGNAVGQSCMKNAGKLYNKFA